MNNIQNNPYRIVGLLVGATAREQERQIKRLKQFIDAGQDPVLDDFTFPTLGDLARNIESVTEAESQLNLDSDKMHAALFWFYNGNPITDEVAFDAIKDGDVDTAIEIWRKLIYDSEQESYMEVTMRNASAFHNLSTLYLQKYDIDADTLNLKLHLLESDFYDDLKNKATGETYRISKKEIQVLFLNSLINQEDFDRAEFIEAIIDIEFSAKDDFLKSFIQKPLEEIEKQIEESKAKRKANKGTAVDIGKALYKQTAENLEQIKFVVGVSNLKYTTIADKVANEILQCSIEYFNYHQENQSETNYFDHAWKLAKSSESIAIGKLTLDRIVDSLQSLEGMKDPELSAAIQLLQSIKDAYEENKVKINQDVRAMPLGYNQSINWSKVNQMIENSLNWDKVVSLIQREIPQKNVDRIKIINNQTKLNEYKSLTTFIMNRLTYLQKNKVKYICYWEAPGLAMPTSGDIEKIPEWLKWLGGIILFIILIKACN
jgi:hypothetical protein